MNKNTNVGIKLELYQKIKEYCSKNGYSIKEFVQTAIRNELERRRNG